MDFEHEVALSESGVTYEQLPVNIKNKINRFNQEKAKIYADPENVDKEKALYLKKSSLVIAEDIQDFVESNYPNDEETQNPNNMSKPNAELAARAKAVGLAETATEAEIVAKEKEIADKAAADKAAADKAKADQDDADKAADKLRQRAKACGLAETATEAEIVAKEKEIADKAAADGKKADDEKNKKKPVYEDNLGLGSDLDL